MKLFLNSNPSRGWHWWSLGTTWDAPLLNGEVRCSLAEAQADAQNVSTSTGIPLAP